MLCFGGKKDNERKQRHGNIQQTTLLVDVLNIMIGPKICVPLGIRFPGSPRLCLLPHVGFTMFGSRASGKGIFCRALREGPAPPTLPIAGSEPLG